ncbi:hypothetical protein BACCAP_00842 [Pseudoflavonifractor capillosus ATCC 29799]|uniref:Uncharacterized protein n=1 Tax=Pseudoflavonifractor capillosus ATCC 29799 TaxID=411467 RepID=A6NRL4_9FIRM|nr:hypothetical protein BACCAP_00842 [Pseudoflavonifractor capillosus ATCC 29799]
MGLSFSGRPQAVQTKQETVQSAKALCTVSCSFFGL